MMVLELDALSKRPPPPALALSLSLSLALPLPLPLGLPFSFSPKGNPNPASARLSTPPTSTSTSTSISTSIPSTSTSTTSTSTLRHHTWPLLPPPASPSPRHVSASVLLSAPSAYRPFTFTHALPTHPLHIAPHAGPCPLPKRPRPTSDVDGPLSSSLPRKRARLALRPPSSARAHRLLAGDIAPPLPLPLSLCLSLSTATTTTTAAAAAPSQATQFRRAVALNCMRLARGMHRHAGAVLGYAHAADPALGQVGVHTSVDWHGAPAEPAARLQAAAEIWRAAPAMASVETDDDDDDDDEEEEEDTAFSAAALAVRYADDPVEDDDDGADLFAFSQAVVSGEDSYDEEDDGSWVFRY